MKTDVVASYWIGGVIHASHFGEGRKAEYVVKSDGHIDRLTLSRDGVQVNNGEVIEWVEALKRLVLGGIE